MADFIKNFKSFEMIYEDESHKSKKVVCDIASIENNYIIVTANNIRNNDVVISPDKGIKIYVYTENGIFSANSIVLSSTKGPRSTEYLISYPDDFKHSQRREYFRADLSIDFRMEVKSKSAPEVADVLQAKTRDVCGKGLSFVSEQKISEPISIRINLYFQEKTVETHADLVYSKQIIINAKPHYIHAFYFTDISQKNIDFIVKKCFLYQLECRRKLTT